MSELTNDGAQVLYKLNLFTGILRREISLEQSEDEEERRVLRIAQDIDINVLRGYLNRMQQTEYTRQLALVKGTIIGALAGGHLDHTPGYSEGVLLQIANLLHMTLPEIPQRGSVVVRIEGEALS